MLKKSTSIFLISIIFLTAFSPLRVAAQIQPDQTAKKETTGNNSGATNLRRVFAESFKESPARLDSKEMERESLNASKRAKLSKGQKTALYLGIAAAVVATVVIIVVARGDDDDDGTSTFGCPGNPLCQ